MTYLQPKERLILKYSLSPAAFMRDILGWIVKPFHEEWLEALANEKRLILLAPRSHGKTTVTIAYTIWKIVTNPDIRILILTVKQDKAEEFMEKIKYHLSHNEKLKEIFGEQRSPSSKWTNRAIIVAGRSKNLAAKEPTLTVSSITAEDIGGHYDIIICVTKDTKIYTSKGWKKAEDLKIGDKVLSKDGKFHIITDKVIKPCHERIVKITPFGVHESSKFTENHLILTWRDNTLKWIPAKDLKKSDFLVIPRPKARNSKWFSRTNERINKLIAKPEIWRLIGYWLAEGCHTNEKSKIRLSFGIHETDLVDDVRQIVKTCLGKDIYTSVNGSTIQVGFYDEDLKLILEKFGTHSYNKHIPPYFINNDAVKQIELIKGYFAGDGYSRQNLIGFVSTSVNLLTGIQLILAKLGISSTIRKTRSAGESIIIGRKCKTHDTFVLESSDPYLRMLLNLPVVPPKKIQPFRSKFLPDFMLVPIKNIEFLDPVDEVVDITVKDENSFFTPGIIAHNCDDIVHPDNVSTEYQRQKLRERFETVIDYMLEPEGEIKIIGTRFHKDDLYGQLMKYPEWKVLRYKAIIREADPERGIEPVVLWEERFPYEKLCRMREIKGPVIFAMQSQNEILDIGGAVFNVDRIKYFDTPPQDLDIYQGVDLATKKGKDYFVIATIGVSKTGDIYILNYYRDHLSIFEQLNKIVEYDSIWKPLKIGVESNAYQAAFTEQLSMLAPVPAVPISPNRDKVTRAQRFATLVDCGKVYVREDMHELLDELAYFPYGEHDDIIDAIVYALQVIERKPDIDWNYMASLIWSTPDLAVL